MKILLHLYLFIFPLTIVQGQNTGLKYIVYDLDGLNMGQTDLPDGDFKNGDLVYSIAANPLAASEVIGDRVVKLHLGWNAGSGEFGKATMRFLELNQASDRLNFYIYNPTGNSGNAKVQLIITEDDNNNNIYESSLDDKWVCNADVPRSGDWQLFSVPLSSFQDGNSGGNGKFDASYTGDAGMLFSVVLNFSKPTPGSTHDEYFLDMLCFTEGNMPQGGSIMDLPSKGGSAMLGALTANPSPDQVPAEVHGYLPAGKRLSFVNWFEYYSNSGTLANNITGPEVQSLIGQDVTPIITWESMYLGYSRLDPVQPRLDDILAGSFDAYIDNFAAKIKSYSGQVILRILHEFEGDWYPWSLTENNKDPAKYVAAYRYIVDRFRTVGAYNVKWMWCLNAEPKPYRVYNYVVACYPGDSYVDIVATDVYNHPNLGVPDWKSFRYTIAESYYYLAKHYSHKPIYICEVGCRERDNEPADSQTKAAWTCQMNRDLQTYFNKVQALVYFSTLKEHDWRINSSTASMDAFVNCIWNDGFYYGPVGVREFNNTLPVSAYPNPFVGVINLEIPTTAETSVACYDITGRQVDVWQGSSQTALQFGALWPPGVYIVEINTPTQSRRLKVVKAGQ